MKKNSVDVVVEITFRDDKKKHIKCWDTPGIGGDWITLYPKTKSPMGRELIVTAAVKDITWDYKPS